MFFPSARTSLDRLAKSLPLAIALAISPSPTPASAQSDYDDAFSRAAAAEAEARYAEAIAELEPLAGRYPDDYAVALQLAWLRYQAGQYAAAEADYRRAAEISRGAEIARLGLAWSLFQQGQSAEAATLFRAILEASPQNASAREGLRLAEAGSPASNSARADFAYVAYQDHPTRDSGWSFAGGFGHLSESFVAWDVAYRFARFQAPAQGGGSGNAEGASSDQHEVYGLLGIARPRYGLHGHFVYVRDQVEFVDDLFAIGLSGRLSTAGRLWAEASVSFYPGEQIFRLAPSWRIPLGGAFYVEPGGGLQVTSASDVLGNGTLELGVESERGALRIGGKYGRERQPLYLHIPLMLNLRDEVRWGLWASGSLRFLGTGELRLTYELNRLDPPSTSVDASMHVIAASVRGSF